MTDKFKPGDKVQYDGKGEILTIKNRKTQYDSGIVFSQNPESEAYDYEEVEYGWDFAKHLVLVPYVPQKGDIVSVQGLVDYVPTSADRVDVKFDGRSDTSIIATKNLTLIERPKPIEPKLPGQIWSTGNYNLLIVLDGNKFLEFPESSVPQVRDMPTNTDHWIKVENPNDSELKQRLKPYL